MNVIHLLPKIVNSTNDGAGNLILKRLNDNIILGAILSLVLSFPTFLAAMTCSSQYSLSILDRVHPVVKLLETSDGSVNTLRDPILTQLTRELLPKLRDRNLAIESMLKDLKSNGNPILQKKYKSANKLVKKYISRLEKKSTKREIRFSDYLEFHSAYILLLRFLSPSEAIQFYGKFYNKKLEKTVLEYPSFSSPRHKNLGLRSALERGDRKLRGLSHNPSQQFPLAVDRLLDYSKMNFLDSLGIQAVTTSIRPRKFDQHNRLQSGTKVAEHDYQHIHVKEQMTKRFFEFMESQMQRKLSSVEKKRTHKEGLAWAQKVLKEVDVSTKDPNVLKAFHFLWYYFTKEQGSLTHPLAIRWRLDFFQENQVLPKKSGKKAKKKSQGLPVATFSQTIQRIVADLKDVTEQRGSNVDMIRSRGGVTIHLDIPASKLERSLSMAFRIFEYELNSANARIFKDSSHIFYDRSGKFML
ncbi:MAG: hypothetical protein AB8E15_06630 [Bdellovibrionales bacterium]